MTMNRLAPDLRDRLAQQVPTSLAQTDPSAFLPPVNTTNPVVAPSGQPGGGYIVLAPPGTPTAPMVAQATAAAGSSGSGGGSATKNINDVPRVEWGSYKPNYRERSGPQLPVGPPGKPKGPIYEMVRGISSGPVEMKAGDAANVALRVAAREKFLQDRLDRYATIAEMAGASPEERKATIDFIRFNLSAPVQVGEGENAKMKDPATMSDKEWADYVEQQVAAAEDPLTEQVFSNQAQGITPGAPQQQALPQPGVWTQEQLMQMQAAATAFMQPYADKLKSMGLTDVAAAYMQQAYNAPLVAQAQQAERYAAEMQALQNQLTSYQQGSNDQLTPEMLAALTGGT